MSTETSTQDRALEIVDAWKLFWFSQEENYQKRVLRIDANMRHDLKKRIAEAISFLEAQIQQDGIVIQDCYAQMHELQRKLDGEKATVRRLQEAYLPGNWEKLEAIMGERERLRAKLDLATDTLKSISFLKEGFPEDNYRGIEMADATLAVLEKGEA